MAATVFACRIISISHNTTFFDTGIAASHSGRPTTLAVNSPDKAASGRSSCGGSHIQDEEPCLVPASLRGPDCGSLIAGDMGVQLHRC